MTEIRTHTSEKIFPCKNTPHNSYGYACIACNARNIMRCVKVFSNFLKFIKAQKTPLLTAK